MSVAPAAKQPGRLGTIAVIGNSLPRRCGIATFTTDLCNALATTLGRSGRVLAVAMNDRAEGYRYPERVRFEVRAGVLADYRLAADYLNINQVDLVILQHEYGIFGGPSGSHILRTLRELRMPVITTLHTVLKEPLAEQRAVMSEIAKLSDRLVVMSHRALGMLAEVNGVPEEKIVMIPHGIPDVPFVDPSFYKDQFGVEGRKVILTFGLLSPGKGIEHLIDAIPRIVEQHPEAVYLLLGATHPQVKKHGGEEYRHRLQQRVRSLGMQDHVIFHDRFVSLEELCQYIGAADVYVTPYLNPEQIVSGTLAYALGAGRAVVSTPYGYALEMLADGRGRIVPFGDPGALADEVIDLLSDDRERNALRKRAYKYCREMVWEEVGRAYVTLGLELLSGPGRTASPHRAGAVSDAASDDLAECDLRHLRVMTDSTGILQHAIYATPRREDGYCTCDNSRALRLTALYTEANLPGDLTALAQRYLAFLAHAFDPETGRFKNFMAYDRQWLDPIGSEDSHGRALYGLGAAVAHFPSETIRTLSSRLFDDALPATRDFHHPRAMAYTLVGIHAYLERFGGDSSVRRTRESLSKKLMTLFRGQQSDDWPWCDDRLTYANATLPRALILSGQWIPDGEMLQTGLTALRWLLDQQTAPEGHLSPIGNDGWMTRNGKRARFDQQPIEAEELIGACAEAYRATRDEQWVKEARRCFGWFLGHNDLQMPVYDFKTGGCCDGLGPTGPNQNQGAESTLAWLTSLLMMNKLYEEEILYKGTATVPQEA